MAMTSRGYFWVLGSTIKRCTEIAAGLGENLNKVFRLTRSIYGLRGASKAFMKQLIGSELEGFSEKVEYKDVDGKTKVEYARF